MAWRPAPAAHAVLEQADARAPRRNRASDGLKGDDAHAARQSHHNPDSRGVVLAVDLTHDPASGIDAHGMVRAAVTRRDPRLLEAISLGEIWTRARAREGWRPYRGHPHDKHAHLSIAREHENDTSPWWPGDQEDEMSPQDWTRLQKMLDDTIDARLAASVPKKDGVPFYEYPIRVLLAGIRDDVGRIARKLGVDKP